LFRNRLAFLIKTKRACQLECGLSHFLKRLSV
jgi:hypothetical protein